MSFAKFALLLSLSLPVAAQTNLALNMPATASSLESPTEPASNAVDGNMSTRVATGWTDTEWWQVDLGTAQSISSVSIYWEAAYGASYIIQTSNDLTQPWTNTFTQTAGKGGNEVLTFPAVTARYVRLQGVARGTPWGYSFYEFQVLGPAATGAATTTGTTTSSPVTSQTNLALNMPATASSLESPSYPASNGVDGNMSTRVSTGFTDTAWWQVDLGTAQSISSVSIYWETAYGASYIIQTSNDLSQPWTNTFTQTAGKGGNEVLTFPAVTARYVRLQGVARGTPWGYSFYEFQVLGTAATGAGTTTETGTGTGTTTSSPATSLTNLALNEPATASSLESPSYPASNAVDGNMTTRVSTGFTDTAWWQVDLGTAQSISSVSIYWEAAYGASYIIQTSNDLTKPWTNAYVQTAGKGGNETLTFPTVTARYVRLQGVTRGTPWGYSFYEFQVLGTAATGAGTTTGTGTTGTGTTGTGTTGTTTVVTGNTPACSAMGLGAGAPLSGFIPFPANDPWRQNIASSPVDANSSALISTIGSAGVHPDFGGLSNGSYIGIPYTVASGTPFTSIVYTLYGDQSDSGPMPIDVSDPIEGYPNPGDGDRHVLVLDRDNCWLYEIGGAYPQSDGTWQAGVGVVWDLLNNNNRPYTWTSSDAAGLPIFPGLVRYDEVASGQINHAMRVTLSKTQRAFVPPATHWASNSADPKAAPMGMRMRLKASFDISSFGPESQVILTAMKNYGLIVADNGSNMYVSGAPDDRWDNDDLHTLTTVPASAFEVVQMPVIYTPSNLPIGPAPTISSFTVDNPTIAAGGSATLSWAGNNASYYVVTPQVGAVRGTSITVSPTTTTTYTIYATNQFGQQTATVTVNVQ